jgi:hypothetical protein
MFWAIKLRQNELWTAKENAGYLFSGFQMLIPTAQPFNMKS